MKQSFNNNSLRLCILPQSHLLSHAEPRPYVCQFCDAGFTNHRALRTHLLTHGQVSTHIALVHINSWSRCQHTEKWTNELNKLKQYIDVICVASFSNQTENTFAWTLGSEVLWRLGWFVQKSFFSINQ